MNEHKIVSNTLSLLGIRVFGVVLGMATQAVLARGLGVEHFGFFTYGLAYLSFFSVAASLGLDTLLIREISRLPQRAAAFIGSAMMMRAAASTAGLLLALTGLILLPANSIRTFSAGLLSCLIFINVLQTVRSYFEAHLQSHRLIGVELLSRGLTLLLVVLTLEYGGGLFTCILVYLSMEYAGAGFVLRIFIKDSQLRPTVDSQTILELFNKTWPLAIQSVLYVVYFRIDMVMLEFYQGIKEVGYYAPAYAVMAGLLFVPDALSRSLFPLLSKEVARQGSPEVSLLLRLVKYFAMVAVPMVIAGSLLADHIILFLFGQDFAPAAGPLRILFLALGVIFLSNLMSLLLLAQNRQRLTLRFVAANTVFNFGMNLFAIPRWGMMGAAVTTVLTEGLGCLAATVAGLWFSGTIHRPKPNGLWIVRSLQLVAAASLMAIVILWGTKALPWFMKGTAGIATFFCTLLSLGWFTPEDRMLIRRVLSTLFRH